MIGAARARVPRTGSAGSIILHIRTGIVLVATTYSSPLKKGWTKLQIGLEYVLFSAVRRDPSWDG
jgi:hypothetical protein